MAVAWWLPIVSAPRLPEAERFDSSGCSLSVVLDVRWLQRSIRDPLIGESEARTLPADGADTTIPILRVYWYGVQSRQMLVQYL